MRSSAGVWFNADGELSVVLRGPEGEYRITLRTRYRDEGFDDPVPRELWVEMIGSALSIENAVETMGNAALSLTSIVAFVANANTGDPLVELAFDTSEGMTDRDFFQAF